MKRKAHPKRFFTSEEEAAIVSAIREAEKKTSGEIRVHLASNGGRGSTYHEAVKTFEKLGMTKTQKRDGILIYLALKSHQFAVVGDIGIHAKVPSSFWDEVRDGMQTHFRQGHFQEGLVTAVHYCGEKLAYYFPHQDNDKNELPDTISSDE